MQRILNASNKILSEWNLVVDQEHLSQVLQSAMEASGDERSFEDLESVKNVLLDTHIKKLAPSSSFHVSPASIPSMTIEVPLFAQITRITDVSVPAHLSEAIDNQHGVQSRLLMVELTDGNYRWVAIELSIPPGTKVLLKPSRDYPLILRHGVLLLRPLHIQILGGNVAQLKSNWIANNEVKSMRTSMTRNLQAAGREIPPKLDDFPIDKPGSKQFPVLEGQVVSETRTAQISSIKKDGKTAQHGHDTDIRPNFDLTRIKAGGDTFRVAESPSCDRGRRKGRGRRTRGENKDNWDTDHYMYDSRKSKHATIADAIGAALGAVKETDTSAVNAEWPHSDLPPLVHANDNVNGDLMCTRPSQRSFANSNINLNREANQIPPQASRLKLLNYDRYQVIREFRGRGRGRCSRGGRGTSYSGDKP